MNKCIIIGSGLGGLSCGVILARNGYQVTVLEQGTQPGGCLQCFKRGGAKFETGMHFIGSADEGQTLHYLLHYLGLETIPLTRLDTSGYDVISLLGGQFKLANGHEAFVETLAKDFPREKDNLHNYFSLIEQIAGASSLHSLRHAESDAVLNTEYQMRSIDDVIGTLINDELLRKVLVGNLPLYAAELGKTPFSTHAFINDFYNHSAFRLAGGSDIIAKILVENIEKLGGTVLTRKKVTKILCDNTKATGVVTADDTSYEADLVISAVHPNRLLEMLSNNTIIRPAYRKRILSVPNTVGGFAVYMKFKPQTMPYLNHNFYGYMGDTPWDCEYYKASEWPKGYLYMHMCPPKQPGEGKNDVPRYAECGELLSYMQFEEMAPWLNTQIGRRGKTYELFKQEKAERLIAAADKQCPGLRDAIENYWTSTPLTYFDYTGTEHGAMYGVAKDITMGAACHVQYKTKIPNLLLTGQNINSHGMLGVLVGSIVTCSELLTAETIYRQIKR